MKNPIKHFFLIFNSYSKKERTGITILIFLILIVLVANEIIIHIELKPEPYNKDKIELLFSEWNKNENAAKIINLKLYAFDPNKITQTALDSFNLPGQVKNNLLKYREAGGFLNRKEDFRKIYGMNDSIYSKVEKYINIEKRLLHEEKDPKSKWSNALPSLKTDTLATSLKEDEKLKNKFVVEINSADTTALKRLNGVGSVFANRIIKYRNLLGGYYRKTQLLEVYNFPEETYQLINGLIEVDTTAIKKIRINFAEYKELIRHPYLNSEQVNTILKYRTQNGRFQNVEETRSKKLIDSLSYVKVRPYFSCR